MAGEQVGDRAAFEAFGLIPVKRGAMGMLDSVEDAADLGCHLKAAARQALDHGRGNWKGVEQADRLRRNLR
jgi:hypothetical protein